MTSKFLTPWDPFGIARSLRSEVDQLVEGALIRPAGWLANWEPGKAILPLDVHTEGDNLIAKAVMPGLKPEEIKVEVDGAVLRILGESKLEQESKERTHHVHDLFYVRLERSVVLPALVDADNAEAVFAKGVLTVTLPKTGEAQTSQIAIKPSDRDQAVAAETIEAQPVVVETVEVETVEAEPVAAPMAEAETIAAAPVEAQVVEAPTAEAHKVERRKARRQKHEAVKAEAVKGA